MNINELITECQNAMESSNQVRSIALYCSERMPGTSVDQISALLPQDMTSIFACDPSSFDARSIFFYNGHDLEKKFAIQLLYQMVMQGTYDMASDKRSYLPLIKFLSVGTEFENLDCGISNYILNHDNAYNFENSDTIKADGILEQIANHFRGFSVNSLHNYRSQFTEGSDLRNIGPVFPLENIKYAEKNNPALGVKIEQLLGEAPPPVDSTIQTDNVAYKTIRGDGNCYYRSVMYKMLQDIVLSTGEARNTLLANFIAELVRVEHMIGSLSPEQWNNFVTESLRKPSQNDARVQHNHLLECLFLASRGMCWNSLNELDEALLSDELDGALCVAARFLVANELVNKQDIEYNGLTISEAASSEEGCANLDDYINNIVLKDCQCAEGIFVNVGLLPTLFGYDSFITVLPRRPDSRISFVETHENQGKEVRMLLRPGHYDALISRDQFAKINAHQEHFYRAKQHLLIQDSALCNTPHPVQSSVVSAPAKQDHDRVDESAALAQAVTPKEKPLSDQTIYLRELNALKNMINSIRADNLLQAQKKAWSEAHLLLKELEKQTPEDSEHLHLAEICSITTQGLRFVVQEKGKAFQSNLFLSGKEQSIHYGLDTHTENMERLSDLACTLKGHGWKTTRNILFTLAIALVVACAVLAAIPTGGVSLLVGLGATAALTAGAGLFVDNKTRLSKTVSSIKMQQADNLLENESSVKPPQG